MLCQVLFTKNGVFLTINIREKYLSNLITAKMYTLQEVEQLRTQWRNAFDTLAAQIRAANRVGDCDTAKLYLQQYNTLYSEFERTMFNIAQDASRNPDWSNIVNVYRDIQILSADWNRSRTSLATLLSFCEDAVVTEETFEPAVTQPAVVPTQPSGPAPTVSTRSVNAARATAQATASARDSWVEAQQGDWRVRLSLAPEAGPILYRAPYEELQDSILYPLAMTDGVIFPYTPNINTTYTAAYEPTTLVHSNYKAYNYTGSYIEAVNITCDFTAQDTFEANYVLAVIHFFRSVTKMFYGQDQYVAPGTPPPLCYLNGLGEFQFNMHPLVITAFNYSLPNNVNYVRASNISSGPPGANRDRAAVRDNSNDITSNRLAGAIARGGVPLNTTWPNNLDGKPGTVPTYIPTAMQVQITAYPVVSRNKVSNEFSLQQYSTGKLLQGSRNPGGAFW
jgi:hypothetical protein